MINFIKSLLCEHNFIFYANLYGDLINYWNCRSLDVCTKCGKYKKFPELRNVDFPEEKRKR